MAVLTAVCLLPAEAEGQCDAVVHDSLPLTEDFEGWNTGVYGPMGECWTRINNGTSFYSGPFVKNLMQYSSELHTYVPNRTMYFHTSVGDEWVVGFRSYLVMPEVEDVRDLTVDFKVRRPDAHPALEVGVMEGTDTSTFVPIAICTPSTYNTFVDYSVPLSGYTGDGGNIAFRTFNVGTYVSEIYLDDIVVWQDSCGAPCCLTASHSEAGSTLHWMAADTTATFLLVLDGTDTAVVSGNSYTLDTLPEGSEHTVSLRMLCSPDSSEAYTATFQMPMLALPYQQGFDSVAVPAGWRKAGGGQVALNRNIPAEGTAALEFMDGAADNMLVLPVFGLEISELYINLLTRPTGINLWGAGMMAVGYVTDAYNTGTFVARAIYERSDFEGPDYREFRVDFDGAPAGARMALRYSGTTNQGQWLVDAVEVGLNRCPAPVATGVDQLTDTSACLHWMAEEAGTTYLVAVGADTLSTTDTALTLTGLAPDSAYRVRLARICDDGDTGAWVNLGFRTDCPTLTHADLPLTEDFDSYATGDMAEIGSCWRLLTPGHWGVTGRPCPMPVVDTAGVSTQALAFGLLIGHTDLVVLPTPTTGKRSSPCMR